ncbi:hypothetical protein V865_007666 [Kwoniella europaea PYCC6329]|uniref:D-isomer specific 2-hydroxyacid dehydrogenase NAD-binding domain-containing protein n=1 Tax=Kwoniella europaea PYCC6329 TaxID=1423913 RepID=A0AAX4KU23_9TREE
MSKILITRHVGTHAMSILESSGYELIVNPQDSEPSREWVLNQIADPHVGAACIMHSQPSDKVDQEFIDACNENLKCVSTFSVGYGESATPSNIADRSDHINVKAAHARGIKIGHTPGVLNDAGRLWHQPREAWRAAVDRLLAFTNRTEPPTIIYTSSRERENQSAIDADFTKRWGVDVKRVEKDVLASQADVLIVLCDLNPSTKDIVNKDFLAKMKPTSILVNVARRLNPARSLAQG